MITCSQRILFENSFFSSLSIRSGFWHCFLTNCFVQQQTDIFTLPVLLSAWSWPWQDLLESSPWITVTYIFLSLRAALCPTSNSCFFPSMRNYIQYCVTSFDCFSLCRVATLCFLVNFEGNLHQDVLGCPRNWSNWIQLTSDSAEKGLFYSTYVQWYLSSW